MENTYNKREVEAIINSTEQRIENEGSFNIDDIIKEESKRVIEQSSSKTMMELNQKFRDDVKGYFSRIDKHKDKYDKYFNSGRYSDEEKAKQKNLMDAEISADLIELQFDLNHKIDRFVNNFKSDKSKINKMEYQMQLSNLLKLLEFDNNLDQEYFDFIVEAKDSKLLKLLYGKYKTETLLKLSTSLDPQLIEKTAKGKRDTILSYLKQGDKFISRNVIFDILR